MPLKKSLNNAHKNGRNQHNANILVGDSESSDESEIELKWIVKDLSLVFLWLTVLLRAF